MPLVDQQPVQGFSGVLPGPVEGTFLVMPDNGFGTKANAPDTLLRLYTAQPDFRHWAGADLDIDAAGKTLDTLLEGTVTGDPTGFLRTTLDKPLPLAGR